MPNFWYTKASSEMIAFSFQKDENNLFVKKNFTNFSSNIHVKVLFFGTFDIHITSLVAD